MAEREILDSVRKLFRVVFKLHPKYIRPLRYHKRLDAELHITLREKIKNPFFTHVQHRLNRDKKTRHYRFFFEAQNSRIILEELLLFSGIYPRIQSKIYNAMAELDKGASDIFISLPFKEDNVNIVYARGTINYVEISKGYRKL